MAIWKSAHSSWLRYTDKNPTNRDGQTTLHKAAIHGNAEVCRLIKANLRDKNPCDEYGITPLHIAARKGHDSICQMIFGYIHGDKNPEDLYGRTPLHLAAEMGHLSTCELFMNAICPCCLPVKDKNPKDHNWTTPLHLAAKNGKFRFHLIDFVFGFFFQCNKNKL